ncbi:MAG: PIG-L family deacetylase [Spirochaetia bacterium]|jgi:6-phosphogluconolactonase/glucosamine-6-phosphate isomerase/deaminase/LmbE family N-acetylglucosaminyl deacetylase
MATIHVIPARDEQNMEQKLVTLLLAAVEEKPDLIVSVFAGTPAFGPYRLLVERARSELVDFSRVRFVVFDELVRAAPTAPFRSVLDERLFAPLSISAENIIAFNPSRDHQDEAARITSWLAVAGIDIALLSVDSRGHIGFHVTGSDFESKAGIISVPNRERWGAEKAFSLGLADLRRAARILLFAAGRNLAEIVQRLTEGSFDPTLPISVLQRHESVTLIADRGALSRIERTERISGFHSGLYIMDAQSVPSQRRALIISPHPDDAPISLGGTMAMISPRCRVVTAVMSTGHRSFIYGTQRSERIAIREAEVVKESRILGVEPRFMRLPFYDSNYEVSERDITSLLALMEEMDTDWVFMPHARDSHPAHIASRRIAGEALRRFLAGSQKTVEVWNFEGPWALFNRGDFNTIVTVPRMAFERKLQAIRAHESQVARTPYDVAAESLGRLRAALVPESELAGFGARPPRLEAWLELFSREQLRGEPASEAPQGE